MLKVQDVILTRVDLKSCPRLFDEVYLPKIDMMEFCLANVGHFCIAKSNYA